MNNKKGISPLISVVILIVVVVSIGVVITTYFTGLSDENIERIDEKSNEITCGADVTLKLVPVGKVYDICINNTGNYTKATLTNAGSTEIDDMSFTIIGQSDVYENTSTGFSINPGETDVFVFDFDLAGSGSLRQMKITPKILEKKGTYHTCADRSIVLESNEIQECE